MAVAPRSRIALLACTVALAAACDAAPPRVAAAPSDPSSPVERVEHGLIPETRVKGERAGWSIEERLRSHHIPGVSIAVIHDYRVVWAGAYGVADVETGAPLTPATLMHAASVSKMVTAMAALKMVEAGRLSLDADVNQVLRSWHVPDSPLTRATPVTLKELLSHTAGVNLTGFPGYAEGEPLPTLLQVLEGQAPANTPPVRVVAEPGKACRYSSGGTAIVQQVLSDVDGRPFPAVMKELVLDPLGMEHSTFEQPLPKDRLALAASAHDFDGTVLPGKHRTYPQMAAGGLWTTPTDVARFLVEVQLALDRRPSRVSTQVATQMTTPVMSLGDGEDDVALGTFVERPHGAAYFGHDGLGEGFLAIARASVKKGDGAVVIANGWQGFAGGELLMEILRSVAVAYGWDGWLSPPIELARVDAAHLAALAGRYGAGPDGSIVVAAKGDRLEARAPFREPQELLPVGGDVFVARADGARFTFRRSASGVDEVVKGDSARPGQVFSRLPDAATEPLWLLESGHFDEALAAYRKLLASSPEEPAVSESRFDDLGTDLLDGRLDTGRALAVFRMNAALHPESPAALASLAEGALRAGRRPEAAAAYQKAAMLLRGDTKTSEWQGIVVRWKLAKLRELGVERN
jgi:CubicO group peptidase (beta-lactamase class C family)